MEWHWRVSVVSPTPSARALQQYLGGTGQLQEGSRFFADAGNTWLRPLKGGTWYSERVCSLEPNSDSATKKRPAANP